jgi:uncharacterized protein (TIGR00290 family)
MSWSGGKDSARALYELAHEMEYEVVELMTTVSEQFRRISHHGVREELLKTQAGSLDIPLSIVYLPSDESGACTNEVYERIMSNAMADLRARGINTVAFGDLFLEDLRQWREANLAKVGMTGIFPIWQRDTQRLSREIIDMGFKSVLTCVEGKVGPGFAGRSYDYDLLRALPEDVDPCGERGEFHSFVYDAPNFAKPVAMRVGETVIRDGRYYADLLPASAHEVSS